MKGDAVAEDVLQRCTSFPSHGIKMETVGFLSLLPVVSFLNTQTKKHLKSRFQSSSQLLTVPHLVALMNVINVWILMDVWTQNTAISK